MINGIRIFLEYFGAACIITMGILSIGIIFKKYVLPLFCEHKYKINGYISFTNETFVNLSCTKCGKEKDIIFDRKELEKWIK